MKSSLNSSAWTVAIDTGNTFIDVCMFQEGSGHIFSVKAPYCPHSPSRSVMEALAGLCRKAGVSSDYLSYAVHGNTLALNALTRNTGCKTALLVTRGFRDVIYLGKGGITQTDPLVSVTVKPLAERRLVFEVSERMLSGGQVQLPLDENELRYKLIPLLEKNRVDSVAVCFLHSCDNPLHEDRVKEIIKKMLPSVPVTVSSDIMPFPGDYAKGLTAVANAAVSPLAGKYIEKTVKSLSGWSSKNTPLWVMQSDGSVITSRQAVDESVRTVLSSPAGGITACALLSKHTGRPNIMTFEMGGAHSCFSIIHQNGPKVQHGGSVAGYPLGISMIDAHTTASGGGSIAFIDDQGHLKVGTESTGATPGPACYARGGKLPTCTDANLILGRLGPGAFLPGGIQLDLESARQAVNRHIAVPLEISLESASQAIIKAANSIMIMAARRMIAKNGCDPREFTLASFGGCGPLHAAEIALELGIPHVLAPIYPGLHSALGMLFTDLRRDYQHKFSCPLTETLPDVLDSKYQGLEEKARAEFGEQGLSENIKITRSADIRYKGQSHVINLQVPSGKLLPADLSLLKRAFDVTCKNECGLFPDQSEVEIVTLRLMAMAGIKGRADLIYAKKAGNEASISGPRQNRTVVFGESKISTPVYDRKDLTPNTVLKGPAVVEQDDSTTLICPRMTASVDNYGNIIIDVGVK